MDDIIYLCPDSHSGGIHIEKKKTSKGEYFTISYYKAFEKKYVKGYFNETQLEQVKKDIEKEKNTIDMIFSINKNELTPDIIKYFRYVELLIEYEEQELLIDPYILGGHSRDPTLTNIDIPIIEAWTNYAKNIGCNITTTIDKRGRNSEIKVGETNYTQNYNIVGNKELGTKNIFLDNLRKYNLIKNKHIPDVYLNNSVENRLRLLAGLMDTDGYLKQNTYEISQKNERLSNNIIKLSRSLGFYTRYTIGDKSCMYKGEKRTGTYYRIIISLNQFSKEVPVLLERKKWKLVEQQICNPFIDINGNVMERVMNKWTEDMKIKLYSITDKIKKLIPNNRIPWSRYEEFDIQFKDFSTGSLQTMYSKTLLPQKEKYDKLIIDVDIQLIEPEWMVIYDEIKMKLENNEIVLPDNRYLFKWLNNQRYLTNNPLKKVLLEELHNIRMKKYRNKKKVQENNNKKEL